MIVSEEDRSCCFSGHREISLNNDAVAGALLRVVSALISRGVQNFYVGGALGFDMLCAIVLTQLKREGAKIRLIFALPCHGYSKFWNGKQCAMQQILLEQADEVIFVSSKYENGCMQRRNRYMVDRCANVVCYLNRPNGGTAYTVGYAKKLGRNIENIANI